jgi:predicted Zn-dependent peptidase
MVTINVLYHVGSKNEVPGRTGFAHLFEHLMFDGSKNVERGGYDHYCTSVGGDNNAYTTSDITDYYISLPSDQLPLGLWLESDRMAEFAIQEISLETQKKVVMEEKRQNTDDAPYGNAMIVMRELAYQPQHPYSWETIGSMADIEAARMEDVRSFYQRFYVPSNATLVIAGDIDREEATKLVKGYFAGIPGGAPIERPKADRSLEKNGESRVLRDTIVPFNAVFLGYHVPSIHDSDIHALELLTAILADGESSRFYRSLEYKAEIASETECFIDDGELGSLLYAYAVGQNDEVTPDQLKSALLKEIDKLATEGVDERELEKAKNRKITRIVHSLQPISSRAERLAYFKALFNNPDLAFHEAELYEKITPADIRRVARTFLQGVSPTVVEYLATKN